jgi:hypothetical protein
LLYNKSKLPKPSAPQQIAETDIDTDTDTDTDADLLYRQPAVQDLPAKQARSDVQCKLSPTSR